MKLNKIVCWFIIGILCCLALYCFLELLCLLNKYSGLLQAVLIIIGFIFVRRQIQIEKNKDLFLNFQRQIETELNFHRERNYQFLSEVEDLIKLVSNSKSLNNNLSDMNSQLINDKFQLWSDITQKYWNIYVKYERKFYTDFTSLNEWWLGRFNINFQELQKSEAYENYTGFTRNLYDKHKEFFEFTPPTSRKISKMITIARDEYGKSLDNLDILQKKFNELLKIIAKEKGIS